MIPGDGTESVICGRYLPQVASTYTNDYRFAPDNSSNDNATSYAVHSYFSTRGTGVKYTSVDPIYVSGAASLAVAASTGALLLMMF